MFGRDKQHKPKSPDEMSLAELMGEIESIIGINVKPLERSARPLTVNPAALATLAGEFDVARPVHVQFYPRLIDDGRVSGLGAARVPDGPEGRSALIQTFSPPEIGDYPLKDPRPTDHLIQIAVELNHKPKSLHILDETLAHELMHCAQAERYPDYDTFSQAFKHSEKHLNELAKKGLDLYGFKFSVNPPVPAGYEINPFEAEARFAQTAPMSIELSIITED